jgi:MoaA/NifB/PqqE/SkfB family radical SAM enzyme
VEPKNVIQAWGQILKGRRPMLSIEVTRECPLRCPGCYAYEDVHLSSGVNLRQLSDFKGDQLVEKVLQLVEELQPLHVSIVGGDPLVRYREMEILLPQLLKKMPVQLVTSAFRQIPPSWSRLPGLCLVVSIDGLQPEHDVRRKPATYERILQNIEGQWITVHCTITSQMLARPTYMQEFLEFWAPRETTKRVWFSIFTPQKGANDPEILSPAQRQFAISEMRRLRKLYPKLEMSELTISEFGKPPRSPEQCVFAQTTETISADLKTRIGPCQFGGNPDCEQCGCIASMAFAGLGHMKLAGIPIGGIFNVSHAIGKKVASRRAVV